MIGSRSAGTTLVLSLAAAAAGADWLVLHDGSRVETQGAWKERGATIVFHLPGGTLSSLPRAEVDVQASHRATAEAEEAKRQAAEPPPVVERKPVLVLTDADVEHVDPADLEAETSAGVVGEATEGDGAAPPAQPDSDLTITGWDWTAKAEPPGIEVTGTMRNTSDAVAANLVLRVLLLDDNGRMAGRATASLVRAALQPGQATAFTAFFPGIYDFSTPRFETQSSMIPRNSAGAPAAAEDE